MVAAGTAPRIRHAPPPAPGFRVVVRCVKGVNRYLVVGPAGEIKRTCWQMETAQMCADAHDRATRKAMRQGERSCLGCGTAFASEGPHNRMCDHCRKYRGVGAMI